MDSTRRQLLTVVGISGADFLINRRATAHTASSGASALTAGANEEKKNMEEVTAVEDLMREHGVIRRALLVYASTVSGLRTNPSSVASEALQKTAKLLRSFGEDYHEKKLEEAFIFPAIKSAGGSASHIANILIAQHQRGREITDYILAVTQGAKIDPGRAEPLARAIESFVLMYDHHAAREDTIVFPAWKKTLSAKQLDEMGDKFEEIEHQQLGEDGFENSLRQISDIEASLGLSDLARFTAPPRPTLP
jgi:hemerythrin-like domain-containing protein